MFPRVINASFLRDYTLRVRFADGVEGEIDLGSELDGEVFLTLRDPALFRQFRVDSDLHTVVWPNGADFAPEFLYAAVRVPA
jgi:hypothetical protein